MKWYLQADTRNDMVEWMSTLRKACKVKNEEKLQDLASSAGLSLKSLEVCFVASRFRYLHAHRKKREQWILSIRPRG